MKTLTKSVPAATTHDPQTFILRPFSSIPKKSTQWLWQSRIPRGKITLLAGDPGTGKTTLALDLAAHLSRAQPMPLTPSSLSTQHSELRTPAATLLLSPYDDPSDTLRPKLESLHANLRHIHLLENLHTLIPSKNSALTTQDSALVSPLQRLEDAIHKIPNLALIIIDPITHFLGLSDHLSPLNPDHPHSPRSILFQLANLAQKHNLAILLTTRLNKNIDPSLPTTSLQRILGPLAFSSAARSVLLIAPIPQNPPAQSNIPLTLETRNPKLETHSPTHLLLPIKLNAAQLPPPLPFTLSDTITWHPDALLPSSVPTPKTPGPPNASTQFAILWLESELANGPVSASTLNQDSSLNAIARSTLERAKNLLGIQSLKQEWSGKWFWQLPHESRPLPEEPIERHLHELLNASPLKNLEKNIALLKQMDAADKMNKKRPPNTPPSKSKPKTAPQKPTADEAQNREGGGGEPEDLPARYSGSTPKTPDSPLLPALSNPINLNHPPNTPPSFPFPEISGINAPPTGHLDPGGGATAGQDHDPPAG